MDVVDQPVSVRPIILAEGPSSNIHNCLSYPFDLQTDAPQPPPARLPSRSYVSLLLCYFTATRFASWSNPRLWGNRTDAPSLWSSVCLWLAHSGSWKGWSAMKLWNRFHGSSSQPNRWPSLCLDSLRRCMLIQLRWHGRLNKFTTIPYINSLIWNSWILYHLLCTLFEHFRIFLFCIIQRPISGHYLIAQAINNSLMCLLNHKVLSSFGTVPFCSGSSILAIVEGMFAIKEEIELCDNLIMVVFWLAIFDEDGEFSFAFLESQQ